MTSDRIGLDGRRIALLAGAGLAAVAASVGVAGALGGLGDDVLQGLVASYGSMTYAFVGVVVLWRRPGHGIGRLSLAIGIAFAVSVIITTAAWLWHPTTGVQSVLIGSQKVLFDLASLVSTLLLVAGMILGVSLLVTWFPDGHRTSRMGRLVEIVLVVSALALVGSSLSDPILRSTGWSSAKEAAFIAMGTIGAGGIVVAYVGAFIDLGLRYRMADPVRRAQMRWVWLAAGSSLCALVGTAVLGERVDWLWWVWMVTLGLPVLAIAIAITRYHLYDIDRIISRSISYLVLTAMLIAVFASIVLFLQAVISSAVASPGSDLDPRVVAISTLAVAALFNPLRDRVQAAVDRRFHRRRYDSGRLVSGFGERMRDQVDLPTVSRELRLTTVEALEPTTTSVWLRARAVRP